MGRIGRISALLLLLLVIVAGIAASPFGRVRILRFALNSVPLNDGYSLTLGESGGNVFGGLKLYDVELHAPASTGTETRATESTALVIAQLDTVEVNLNYLPLFSGTVSIKSLDIRGPTFELKQNQTGDWNVLKAFQTDTLATTQSSVAIRIGSASVRSGALTVQYQSSSQDSVLTAGDILIAVADVALGDKLEFDLQEFQGKFNPPGLVEPAFIRSVASVQGSVITIDTLIVSSPRTNLRGRARASLPEGFFNRSVASQNGDNSDSRSATPDVANPPAAGVVAVDGGDTQESDVLGILPAFLEKLSDLDLDLRATPVAFADIAPFLPTIDANATGTIVATIDGRLADAQFDVNADFGPHGSFVAKGKAGLSRDRPASIEIDASINELRASLFNVELFKNADVIDGSVVAALSGSDLSLLNGNVTIALRETALGTLRVTEPRASAIFTNGLANYDASLQLAGQPLRIVGKARPVGGVQTYDATVTLTKFDLSRLGPAYSNWRTSLTGNVAVEGDGFSNPSLNISAKLNPSTLNRYSISNALAGVQLLDDRLNVDVQLTGRSGSASAKATVNSMASQDWTLEQLALSNFDVASILGDTKALAITGTSTASGSGWSFATMQLSGVAAIDSARFGEIAFSDFDLKIRKIGNAINFEESGAVNGARIRSRGLVEMGDILQLNVSEGVLEEFDLGRYVTGQSTSLNGSFDGSLAGTSLADLSGTIKAKLGQSRVNATTIDDGNLTALVERGQVGFELDVSTATGGLSIGGTFDPFGLTPSYKLTRSTFNALNVGALTGNDALSSNLNGSIEGNVAGTSLASLRGAARVRFERSNFNGIGELEGTIQLDATDTLASAIADLRWEGGGLAKGFIKRRPGADSSADYRHQAALTLQHLDFGRWLGSDSLSSDLSAELEGSFSGKTLSTAVGNGKLIGLSGRYQGLEIATGSGAFSIDKGILNLDQVLLNANAGTLLANGTVALLNTVGAGNSNLSFDANIIALKPIADLVPRLGSLAGSGRVLGQVSGPPHALQATAELTLDGVDYNDRRFTSIVGNVDASFDSVRALSMFDANAELANVVLPTVTIRETSVHIALVDSVFQFEGVSIVDDRRSVQLSGLVDPRAEVKAGLLEDLTIRLDQDRWELLQPSTITYGKGIRVKNLLLFTDDQQIALDGIVDINGEQSLILTVENFRIASIADLFNYGGLGGTANGYLDLTGPADAPIVQGDLSFDVISNRTAVGDMQLSLRYDSLQLFPDALFRHVDGSTLTITGKLPIDLRLAESQGPTQTGVRVAARQALPDTQVDLQVVADSFSMGWMLPFLDKEMYNALDGKFDGQVQVSGTVRNPALSGAARIVNGKIGLPAFGITPDRISAELEFDGNEIRILRGQGKSGSGSVVATGQINLSELSLGEFDISLSMDKFLAMDNIQFRGAKTSGDLLLYGTTRSPTVSGYLLMDALDIIYTGAIEEFEPVKLSEEELRLVEQTFGRRVTAKDTTTFSFYDALQIDINLEMERNTWLRSKQNPRMNIEFAGDMDLQKEPNKAERMFGTINVLPERSTIDQFGRRFDIQSGTVTYNGDVDDPRVDIAAKYTVKSPTDQNAEVEITLNARGSLQNIEIELNSDPQMELTDILSYILTGRPAAQTLQFSGGGEAGLATDIALSQATGYLEGLAGSELGLDVVRIENDGSEIKLTAGKYIREGVYLAISQPVVLSSSASGTSSGETNRPEFTVEVKIVRDLLARLLQQGSGFKLTLFWKHAY